MRLTTIIGLLLIFIAALGGPVMAVYITEYNGSFIALATTISILAGLGIALLTYSFHKNGRI